MQSKSMTFGKFFRMVGDSFLSLFSFEQRKHSPSASESIREIRMRAEERQDRALTGVKALINQSPGTKDVFMVHTVKAYDGGTAGVYSKQSKSTSSKATSKANKATHRSSPNKGKQFV